MKSDMLKVENAARKGKKGKAKKNNKTLAKDRDDDWMAGGGMFSFYT